MSKTPTLPTFDKNSSTDEIVKALRHVGGAIIRNQVSDELADSVRKELRPHFDAQGKSSESEFNGFSTLRLSRVLAYSRSAADIIGHSRIMEIADAILLDQCVNYQLGSTTGIEIHPGETAQELHRDDEIYPLSMPGINVQFSALWALDDFTKENGATHVAINPRRKLEPFTIREEDVGQAVMPKGSVLLYLGQTWHGGGANRSQAPRAALINTYSLGWLKPEVNYTLMHPKELVHSFDQPIPRLLGYQGHGSHIGQYPGDPDGMWNEDED